MTEHLTLAEALAHERQSVRQQYETRLMIAVQAMHRAVVLSGFDSANASDGCEVIAAIFAEMLNESCIAGLPWVASDGSISVQDHVADAQREARAMLSSIVQRLTADGSQAPRGRR
jgi:hypothetical protein